MAETAADASQIESIPTDLAAIALGNGRPALARPAAATVEHMLYALIVLAGLGMRLLLLGAAPMATQEAAASWAAWMDATALHPAAAPATTSALLHALQTAVFWLTGGANELLARLPVALLSSAIALLPWYWRDTLGRPAALVLAVLLAIDPWLLAFGRMADPTALSATLALIALTAMHVATRTTPRDEDRPIPAAIAAVSTGLLLVSGPQAWSWLVVLALYLLVAAPNGRALLSVRTALIAAGAALLGATGWFAWPQEPAMVGASLNAWLGILVAGPYNLLWLAARLLVDQRLLLFFGPIGVVLLWRRPAADNSARLFLTLWVAWALLLLLLPGRMPEMLPLLAVPLAVGAACTIQWLLRVAQSTEDWSEGGLLALVLAVALLSLFLLSVRSLAQATPDAASVLAIPLMLTVVALLLALFAWLVSARQALVIGVGVVALFLLVATFSSARLLAFTKDPAHPAGLFASATWPDAATLRTDVRALSDRRTGFPTELPVQIVTGPTQAADPLIGWLLRDMSNLAFVTAPVLDDAGDPARAPLVIMPPSGEQLASSAWNDNYIGRSVHLRAKWLPKDLPPLTGYENGEQRWNAGWRPRLRWVLFRTAPALPVPEDVDLWVTPR